MKMWNIMVAKSETDNLIYCHRKMKYLQFNCTTDMKTKLKKCSGFVFLFFPFGSSFPDFSPLKPIQKLQPWCIHNVYNYFKHNTFHINNTYYYHSLTKSIRTF